tara:strand:+ start:179 stop:712 length:534 start_codon:yes stop_codon:yes gene_type:complete
MTKSIKLSGIILKKTPYFEKDCLVELLTQKNGKKKIIAKNAFSKSFKFGGLIEPTNNIQCELYQGKTFLILNQCTLKKNYPQLHSHFNTLSLAFYCINIIRYCTPFDLPTPHLYQLLNQTLEQLKPSTPIHQVKNEFQRKILNYEGLLNNNNAISDQQFIQLFYEYTNYKLKQPVFL